jgi:2-polyprenyl-3-methyl-5-hydroxy-6-metoxy-1,4-benzoquinol methylase
MFCPVCHSGGVLGLEMLGAPPEFYRNVTGDNGVITKRMLHCGTCHAVVGSDIAFMNIQADAKEQSRVNQDFYFPASAFENLDAKVGEFYTIIAGFDRFFRGAGTIVELGAGLGLLTRAAGRRFARAIGVDLEVSTALSIGMIPENVEFIQHEKFVTENLPKTTIGALAAWHVLEHLPNPHAALGPFLDRIEHGGVFFGQVPLLKAEHVISAHHVFYRAETLVTLCNPYGLELVYIEKDEPNGFLSFCFRKY